MRLDLYDLIQPFPFLYTICVQTTMAWARIGATQTRMIGRCFCHKNHFHRTG